MISIWLFYTFCYNVLSILYNLLSHIHHAVWLDIFFEYLLYFISLVFWFQNSDLISEIHSYQKIILWKNSHVHRFFVTVNIDNKSQKPTLSLGFFVMCLFSPPLWFHRWQLSFISKHSNHVLIIKTSFVNIFLTGTLKPSC